MKNLKGNNKGFSLVELIVVIAIMGILAVTLAPRLMHYVEKTRVASDQEIANAVLTAAKLGYMQYEADFDALDLADGSQDGILKLGGAVATPSTTIFEIDATNAKKWTKTDYLATNDFVKEIKAVIDDFEFKSSDAGATSQITIKVVSDRVSVELNLDGVDDGDAGDKVDTYIVGE